MDNTSMRSDLEMDTSPHIPSTSLYSRTGTVSDSQRVSWEHIAHYETEHAPTVSIRSAVKELLETAIYILLVFVIVRSMVQNFKIEGSSMEPSLHTGQYILVNKLIYFHFDLNAPLRLLPGYANLHPRIIYPLSLPKRGDIVVFEYPNDIRKDYIKRVIGLPGDKIRIKDGSVYVNDQLLKEPYLTNETKPNNPIYCNPGHKCSYDTIVVPEGSVFVLGDNRGNSSDSREWDSLSLDHVIGQAWLLYYPLDNLGIIPHPTYASH